MRKLLKLGESGVVIAACVKKYLANTKAFPCKALGYQQVTSRIWGGCLQCLRQANFAQFLKKQCKRRSFYSRRTPFILWKTAAQLVHPARSERFHRG
jgi:hypothetical protein